ncbi:Crp/Fnr family transcriptional regulator [Chitinophaga sp. Cy-1792]|nr:Crp/Fnr family transcriptional regulator [Chitinophaga sp. Cy-1792]
MLQYISINEERLLSLADFFEERTYNKKEILMKEGELCKEKFFICKGCVQTCFTKTNGVVQTVEFSLENWWATDFNAFSKGIKSQYTIQAIEKTVVMVLSAEHQERLLKEFPEMERYFHLVFQRAYAATQHRIRLLYELSREELFENFVRQYPAFVQRVPQYLLASFLGFTPEYLSKLRKKHIS